MSLYRWFKNLFSSRSSEAKGSGIIVGKILEIKKHPNADKLQLVTVDIGGPSTGAQGKRLSVVCGAWNIRAGDMVPVATVGTKLPNGLEIKEAEIRGERSQGMLCAEDELGLETDHAGIMILSPESEIGSELLL